MEKVLAQPQLGLSMLWEMQHPAEVPDRALVDSGYMLLTCNARGMSSGLTKGSLCSPHTSC